MFTVIHVHVLNDIHEPIWENHALTKNIYYKQNMQARVHLYMSPRCLRLALLCIGDVYTPITIIGIVKSVHIHDEVNITMK